MQVFFLHTLLIYPDHSPRLNNDAIIPHLLENVKFLCEISSILFKTAGKPAISADRKTVLLPVVMINALRENLLRLHLGMIDLMNHGAELFLAA